MGIRYGKWEIWYGKWEHLVREMGFGTENGNVPVAGIFISVLAHIHVYSAFINEKPGIIH